MLRKKRAASRVSTAYYVLNMLVHKFKGRSTARKETHVLQTSQTTSLWDIHHSQATRASSIFMKYKHHYGDTPDITCVRHALSASNTATKINNSLYPGAASLTTGSICKATVLAASAQCSFPKQTDLSRTVTVSPGLLSRFQDTQPHSVQACRSATASARLFQCFVWRKKENRRLQQPHQLQTSQ